jgi:hypothetical protein
MEAGALLARLGADGRRRTAWLVHLSERANSPQIATNIVSSALSIAQVSCIDIYTLPRCAILTWESDRLLQ